MQEVRELAAVAVPQHLATSRVAQAAAGARTHLTLTSFSLELLMGFLHSARLPLVLGVLNEHADFNVRTHTQWETPRLDALAACCPLVTGMHAAMRAGRAAGLAFMPASQSGRAAHSVSTSPTGRTWLRRLQVAEGPPVGGAQEGADEGAEALEAALREVAPFNSGPLRLGVLQVSTVVVPVEAVVGQPR